jgi:hypothetical protein
MSGLAWHAFISFDIIETPAHANQIELQAFRVPAPFGRIPSGGGLE